MTLLALSPKSRNGYVSPKDEEAGEESSQESDTSSCSSVGLCRDNTLSDQELTGAPRLERTRLWRRDVVERNIKFGASLG